MAKLSQEQLLELKKEQELRKVFDDDTVNFLKSNQEQITYSLLEKMRSFGNAGKQLAIDILDMTKDAEMFYIDSFGNRTAFDGNRKLKKSFTKFDLKPIHLEEIERCAKDVHYFKDNYIKIRTKSGVNFPEMRSYQNDFLNDIIPDENESVLGLMGRQSGKTVTTGIYLSHAYTFKTDLNIGITANRASQAREFLATVKNMIIELPIWMQPATVSWNKSSIESSNKTRILTDSPSSDAFRGFTIHVCVVDECVSPDTVVTIRDNLTGEIFDITIGELNERIKGDNEIYEVLTPSGFSNFSGIKESNSDSGLTISFDDGSDLTCTSSHLIKSNNIFVEAENLNIGDCVSNKKITNIHHINYNDNYYDLVDVELNNEYYTNGVISHNCAFIRPTIWNEFADSIFPSQSGLAWKKNIIISTMNGMNHYYDMIKGARENSNGYVLNEVDWRDVPRYKPDGSLYKPEEFQKKIIDKHGQIYFEQNYANAAIGSSYTLINAEALKRMKKQEPDEIRDGKLSIYEYPQKNHKYIMSVDSAKDGIDDFSVQIIDITTFDFKQVATANLQIDYLLMPEFIHEWCRLYNNPYLIIENNEGAGQSIADQLYQNYDYENLHFDKTDKGRKKRYPGFRTTSKSRRQILQTMKLFIDNNRLEIIDSTLINQLRRFILINNKYQADEGCKDDAVMAMALAFAPFCNTNNFEDMKELIQGIYFETDCESDEVEKEFFEYLTIGDFDDGSSFANEYDERNTYGDHGYNDYDSNGL